MTITQDQHAGIQVLSLAGRMDATNSAVAQEQLLAIVSRGGNKFVLDLAALDYLSSAGLRAMLVAGKHVHSRGGKVGLCNLSDYVREIIEIAGFDTLFAIHGTREQALTDLA